MHTKFDIYVYINSSQGYSKGVHETLQYKLQNTLKHQKTVYNEYRFLISFFFLVPVSHPAD